MPLIDRERAIKGLRAAYDYCVENKSIALLTLIATVIGVYINHQQLAVARHPVPVSIPPLPVVPGDPIPADRGMVVSPPPEAGGIRRERYRAKLKQFMEAGSGIYERFIGHADTDANAEMVAATKEWTMQTAGWICSNMGISALDHFANPGRMPLGQGMLDMLSQTKTWALFMMRRDRLQEIIDRDTWDPVGAPVIRSGGCIG